MQTPGTYISAVGHVGLIGWLLLGWGMQSQPTPMETMDVSVVSGEEFEQMMAARTPEPGDAPPDAPVLPEVVETPPPPAVVETPPPPPPPVETPPPPVVQAPPPPPAPAEPAPAPDLPPSPDPTQAPADRIASTPTAPPPPDALISDIAREAVVPDDSAQAEVVVPEQQATAPEQTATEIVIADETPRGAVETSLRPIARPTPPTPPAPEQVATAAPEPDPAPAPEPDPVPTPDPAPDTSDAVADALAAALAGSAAPAVAAGPPMTGSERDSFRVAVNSCWNVDPGSVAARVTVEVGFSLTREGRVDGEPRLISSDGDQSATNTAYEAARRAILRCQGNGYQLPADKYDQWREVVITFDPSGMRLR